MEPCPRCHLALPGHAQGCPASHEGPLEATAVLTSASGRSLLPAPPPSPSPQLEPRPGDLAPGTRVGEYEITGVLGRGGMGTVYGGVHPVIGKRVAIKVLQGATSVERGALERFQREAQAASRIGHPAVVDVFSFGKLPGGVPYLVMELLAGESLGQRLRRGPLPFAEVREIFLQLLSALQAAHEVGVVHRDLKPDNVMLLRRPTLGGAEVRALSGVEGPASSVKILDFGIAKLIDDDVHLTRSGLALGTPAYMSPEQALGRPVGPPADLYAAAVMLYLCCAGRPPFTSDSVFDVQRKHVTEPPPPPSRYVELPAELEALLLRGLQKAPEARFPSARAMAEALAAVPPCELRPRTGAEASALSPVPPLPPLSGAATLPDVARRHLRKLQVVFCPLKASAAARPHAELLEDNLATRLFAMAEVEFVRPPVQAALQTTGRMLGEAAARAVGADLYLEVTLQTTGEGDAQSVRANLRIGNTAPDEAPYSARAQARADDLLRLEDELFALAEKELKQRARSHTLRVQLVDDQPTHPARRALRIAEEAFSSPWSQTSVIETALRCASDALTLDPTYGAAYYRRGTARLWLAATAGAAGDGQLEAAATDLAEAQRRLPQLAAAHLFAAMVQAIRGRITEGLAALDQAASLEVTRTGLRAAEAIVYDVTLAWPQLLASVLPSDDLFADQGLPLLCLARALCVLGRLDEAEAVLGRLLPIEDADLGATRVGARRTMRTLPLYGPSLTLGALRLRQGRAAEACDLLAATRARLQSCEHVTAPVHLLLALRLLRQAKRQAGQLGGLREVEAAEAVLGRRLLGEDPQLQAERSLRLFSVFWAPGYEAPPPPPPGAPPWRHYLSALVCARAGDFTGARAAAEAMRAAAPEAARADADLLLGNIEGLGAL